MNFRAHEPSWHRQSDEPEKENRRTEQEKRDSEMQFDVANEHLTDQSDQTR